MQKDQNNRSNRKNPQEDKQQKQYNQKGQKQQDKMKIQKIVSIGMATFNFTYIKKQIQNLNQLQLQCSNQVQSVYQLQQGIFQLVENVNSIFFMHEFFIGNKMYKLCKWKEIFQMMLQCRMEYLRIVLSQSSTILQEISHIVFNNLARLKITYCHIDNLEAVSFLNCQKLQAIDLSDNHITRISSFAKLNLKFIGWLFLFGNPINEITALTKGNFNEKIFNRLLLHLQSKYQYSQHFHKAFQNSTEVIKMNSKQIKEFKISSLNTIDSIKQQKIIQIFAKKNISFY